MVTMTKKIESLTPGQELNLIEWRDRWFRAGTCTNAADRPRAEAAITQMYAEIGKPAPRFIWADSPLTANIIMYLISDKKGNSLCNSLGNSLCNSLGDSLWDSLRDSLWDSLQNSLLGSVRD